MQLNSTIRTKRSIETHICGFTHTNQEGCGSLCISQKWYVSNFIQMVVKNTSDGIIFSEFLIHAVHAVPGRAEEDSCTRPG